MSSCQKVPHVSLARKGEVAVAHRRPCLYGPWYAQKQACHCSLGPAVFAGVGSSRRRKQAPIHCWEMRGKTSPEQLSHLNALFGTFAGAFLQSTTYRVCMAGHRFNHSETDGLNLAGVLTTANPHDLDSPQVTELKTRMPSHGLHSAVKKHMVASLRSRLEAELSHLATPPATMLAALAGRQL